MRYIEAPAEFKRLHPNEFAVFLAGGITGAGNWQAEIVSMLVGVDAVLINPRRADFPIDDPSAAEEQITWEFDMLQAADVILFWFIKDAVQPIALYELGAWSMTDKPLVVGVEPGFWRESDVYIQTRLKRPDIEIMTSLAGMADRVRLAIAGLLPFPLEERLSRQGRVE